MKSDIMNQWFFKLMRALAVSAVMVFSFAACEGDGPADPGKGGENVDDNGNGGSGNGGNGGNGGDNGAGTEPQFKMVPVDLGLSGKWAESNLGTTVATENGNYYAWNATDPVPGLCGKDWRMPTKAEFEELLNKCNVEEATQDGVKGYKITSKSNSNSIFLPAAGYVKGGDVRDVQAYGYYWSSTACKSEPAAWYLDFMMERGHQGTGEVVRSQYMNRLGDLFSGSDLVYSFWNSGAPDNSLKYYPDGSFTLSWSSQDERYDVIGEIGLMFKTQKTYEEIGHFAADYSFTKQEGSRADCSYLGIYGWTKDPLKEFYIVEGWVGSMPSGLALGNRVSEYEVDGDTYGLYWDTRNGPTVFGSQQLTYDRYIGIRKSGRQKGHVDISAHFDEWKKTGKQLGKLERVVVVAEILSNTGGGQGSVDFTYVNIYPQASYLSWLEENGLSGSDWYDTPDKWGGDVTNAYMYNKGKDQPLRFPAGFDPCLNLREQTLLQSIRPVTK